MTDSDLISKLIFLYTTARRQKAEGSADLARAVFDVIGEYIAKQIEGAEGIDMEKVQKTYCESMMDNQGLCEKPTMEGIVQWAIHEKGCTYFEAELVLDKVMRKDGMGGWG